MSRLLEIFLLEANNTGNNSDTFAMKDLGASSKGERPQTEKPSSISPSEKIVFGEYVVDSAEESMGVMRSLAMFHIAALSAFLQKLKKIASIWNRAIHQDMLIEVEKRFQGLREALVQATVA
ncbi:MAG: hypothetical protein M1822_004713 [Bathelium mastoideum]|nr:MAG: hypothetical protein M1822_004713 [Bathelium mastoideum]